MHGRANLADVACVPRVMAMMLMLPVQVPAGTYGESGANATKSARPSGFGPLAAWADAPAATVAATTIRTPTSPKRSKRCDTKSSPLLDNKQPALRESGAVIPPC